MEEGAKARRLSVCAYAEWALGPSRVANAPFIVTERCLQTGDLLARNPEIHDVEIARMGRTSVATNE